MPQTLIGRLVSWPTTLVSTAILVTGLLQQFIKMISFGFVPSPVAWIAALAPLYFLPFPVSILPCLICSVLGLTGIPSFGGKKNETAPAPAVVVDDEEDEEESIIFKLLKPLKQIGLLFLAFGESLIGLSPVVENNGRFWDKLYAGECKVYPPPAQYVKDNKFPKEKWIYINGILTEKSGAKSHARLMYSMFGRPVTVVHNPTDGALLDIIECIAGKTDLIKFGEIEPRKVLMAHIKKSLKEAKANGIEKVVLIAHSQGTIITGNTIRLLGQDDEVKGLMKELLEVHTFAGCAHQMPAENVKYLENLSNRSDVVAWLGHIFPDPLKFFWRNTSLKAIDYRNGESFIEEAEWGHFLDDHYLTPMMAGKFSGSKIAKEYLKGGKQN